MTADAGHKSRVMRTGGILWFGIAYVLAIMRGRDEGW